MTYTPTYTEKKQKKIDKWKKVDVKDYKTGNGRDWTFGLHAIIKNGVRYVKDFEDNFKPESIKKPSFSRKQPVKKPALKKALVPALRKKIPA